MRRSQRILVACAVVALVAAQSSWPAHAGKPIKPQPAQYVQRSGTNLVLGSTPYRFTGLNIYNANSLDDECWYSMGDGPLLDQALAATGPGNEAMRAWFFQSLATRDGVRDWSAFDHTLAVAKARGVRVIVTLTNQWGDCEGDGTAEERFKRASWYRSGYRTQRDPEGTSTYLAWVNEVVKRYKGDPTVLMWQLVNEAEVKETLDAPDCAADDAQALRAFADAVGRAVKKIDRNHLVSLGTIGGGQCGTQEGDYELVHASPWIDVCEVHDYAANEPLPGDEWNGLEVRIEQCDRLGKPLIVGEAGIKPRDLPDSTLGGRAAAFGQKLDAQLLGKGVDGFLAWAYSASGSSLIDFDIGPADPSLAVLGSQSYG